MSSAILSAEYVPGVGRLDAIRPVPCVGSPAISWSWRKVGENASGLMFLTVLGWEVWRIGGQLLHYVTWYY